MKKFYSAGKAVLTLAFVLSVSSCTTTSPQSVDANPHFQDESSVNAVLQFSSWDYTFLVRPQYMVGGYLEQVRRENIAGVFDKLKVQRGTAVVVVGWTYNGDTLTRLVSDWKSILSGCGFQRVIVLRAQMGNRLNGSIIVDDSILHVGSVQQGASRGG